MSSWFDAFERADKNQKTEDAKPISTIDLRKHIYKIVEDNPGKYAIHEVVEQLSLANLIKSGKEREMATHVALRMLSEQTFHRTNKGTLTPAIVEQLPSLIETNTSEPDEIDEPKNDNRPNTKYRNQMTKERYEYRMVVITMEQELLNTLGNQGYSAILFHDNIVIMQRKISEDPVPISGTLSEQTSEHDIY